LLKLLPFFRENQLSDKKSYGKKVKNIFLAGLAVVIPVGVTVYILAFIVGMMDSFLAVLPGKAHPDRMLGFHVPGLGVVSSFYWFFWPA